MAAITVTAASVKLVSGTQQQVTYGEAVAQGQPVRLDSTTNRYILGKNDAETDAEFAGVALTPGGNGDQGVVALPGSRIYVGGSSGMSLGAAYYVGPNDGEIVPYADLLSADYITLVGICVATDTLQILSLVSGETIP